MVRKDCDEIINNKIDAIITVFRKKEKEEAERIATCLYTCFKEGFIKWSEITYQRYDRGLLSFAADSAFSDAIVSFLEKAEKDIIMLM